jgi:hypothetical protein
MQTTNAVDGISSFVVGGLEAVPGMFPWTASLQYRDEAATGTGQPAKGLGPRRAGSKLSHNCGGVLVTGR